MKRILLLFCLLLGFALPAAAQGGFTTVTGTITDPNGVKWACGTISAQLITAGGAAPTLNGGSFTTVTSPVGLGCPTSPGTGAPGSFRMLLADSGVILPSNTTWKFTVGTAGNAPPLGTGPQSFSFTTAINCSTNTPSTCIANSMDISAQLSALAPALGGSGGASSPSSLTTFFNLFMGLSPLDTGATGSWQVDQTCTSNSTTTVTCTSGRFKCPFPSGTIYELSNGGTGPGGNLTVNTGTVTCVSTTQVSLSAASTFNLASTATFEWGSDDTAGLQSWANGINAAGSVHGGYIPRGGYHFTESIRLIAPPASDCNNAYPVTNLLTCSLIIWGAGATSSNFYPATAGNFNQAFPNGTVNNGFIYLNGFTDWELRHFSIICNTSLYANDESNSPFLGALVSDVNQHGSFDAIYIDGCTSTPGNFVGFFDNSGGTSGGGGSGGLSSPNSFESRFQPIIEKNNINMWLCGGTGAVCEKETVHDGFLEAATRENLVVGGGGATTLRQILFDNMHFDCSNPFGVTASTCFRFNSGSISGTGNDGIRFSNSRFNNDTSAAPSNCLWQGPTASTGVAIDFSNTLFDLSGTGTTCLIQLFSGTAVTMRINGGALSNRSSCTIACLVNNADTTSFVYIGNTGTFPVNSTDTFKYGGTGVGNIVSLEDYTTPFPGVGGRGAITAAEYLTFANCSSSASPAVCGAASAGSVTVAASATTEVVDTTAVTANSQIQLTFDSSLGTKLGVTCNTTTVLPTVSARTAGTSFTITVPTAPTTNPACFSYEIKN